MKKSTLATLGLLSLLYLAPVSSAATHHFRRNVELPEASIRVREPFLPRLVRLIAKQLGFGGVSSNTDAAVPPRP